MTRDLAVAAGDGSAEGVGLHSGAGVGLHSGAGVGLHSGAGVGYWFSTGASAPDAALRGAIDVDVAIIGGGFTGLWTAIRLTGSDPTLRVAILEQAVVGFGASGRNGGFCEASLTHGLANGIRHFPDEIALLEAEGVRNLAELVEFVREQRIDCDLEATGSLRVADQPHQAREFEERAAEAAEFGQQLRVLDRATVQDEIHSPTWLAGLAAGPEQNVILNPAKLAWGLKRVALERGVLMFEGSRVTGLERIVGGVRLSTVATESSAPLNPVRGSGTAGRGSALRGEWGRGSVRAARAVVATSAYSGWFRRLSRLFVPVYDYVLVSEPLTPAQNEAIGWRHRQGVSDSNNQFHYFRLTADNRILWGGYDAIHHFGSKVGPEQDRRPATFKKLEAHFRRAFPQLADLRFPFRWGGAIDTTSRFTVTFGQTLGGRVTYALGYTGLGVGATRWAAGIVRDFILRPDSDLLQLRFVRSSPFPFPPEPARSIAVETVRRELARADDNGGRRGPLLQTLDALGIGFDS